VSEGATSWTAFQTVAGVPVGIVALVAAELCARHPLTDKTQG
jgi:hypothetical protein